MIYLDTHLVIWLTEGRTNTLSNTAKELIQNYDLLISPIIMLELQLLYEVNRITITPKDTLKILEKDINLKLCHKDFNKIIQESISYRWTRDPFDRIITAQAALHENLLLTKDESILKNYKFAVWN